MAKIVAWLIVIFVVMLVLRIANLRKARARRARETSGRAPAARVAQPMVRCVRCGVYLPRVEAKSVRGGYACAAGECASHA